MSQNSEVLPILDRMRIMGNLRGIIISSKNGDLIIEKLSKKFEEIMKDLDNFTAMCATIYEGAVGIAHNSNNEGINQIFAELMDHNLIIRECNEDMIFIMIFSKSMNISALLAKFHNFAQKVNDVIDT